MRTDPLDVAKLLRSAYGESDMDPSLPGRVADTLVSRPRRVRTRQRVIGMASFVLVAGAVAAAVIVTLPPHGVPIDQSSGGGTIEATGPAVMPAGSNGDFVWFQGTVTSPPTVSSSCGTSSCTASLGGGGSDKGGPSTVYVFDWTGGLRYRFQLPTASAAGPAPSIQAVSPDGTRALLSDGSVIDQTGRLVGSVASLAATSGVPGNGVLWAADDSGGCSVTVDAANRGVTVSITTVPAGESRVVAVVGAGDTLPAGVPATAELDTAQVLACSPATDTVVVARYHEPVDGTGGTSSTIWALRLSNGGLVFHQPEVQSTVGQAVASSDGQVIAEEPRLSANSSIQPPVVVELPGGQPVTSLGDQQVTTVVAISAAGDRILLDSLGPGDEPEVAIVDPNTGGVVWRVPASWNFVTAIRTAATQPDAPSFLASLPISPTTTGELLLLDGNGGVTILKPSLPQVTYLSLIG